MGLSDAKPSATSIWRNSEEVPDPFLEVQRLGLEANVAELEAHGYTVVPPHLVASPAFIEELRDAILKVAESRRGIRPDLATGESHRNIPTGVGQHIYNMLLEGEPFERAVINQTVLALVTYLLGQNCLISSMTSIVKGPGTVKLDLHADVLFLPPPYPSYAIGTNATWALTEYSRENGSTCFWPGSHKFCRQPTPEEREDMSSLVPIEAPAGSLIVWHSNTWHAAQPRTKSGLRVSLVTFYSRPFMFVQEDYRNKFSQAAIDRHGPRFARLIGKDMPFPMSVEGPDREKLSRLNSMTRTQWG